MVRVVTVKETEKSTLDHLMQKYLYEMTKYYADEMDEEGNYSYKYLPLYFTEKDRQAYFLFDGETRIGFALVNAHSFTEEKIGNCLAEFTIFPRYRNQGYGFEAIEALHEIRTGKWQLKCLPRNMEGAALWRKVKEKYNGTEQALGDEMVLTFA